MSSSSEATSSAEGPSPPPCAGCKHLRRWCVPSCAFAAYFPPEHGDQFAAVHKVFGASNVSKLLAEVAPAERAGAVESLVYEARARLRDPAFGCVSYITVLEHVLKQAMGDVAAALGELAAHVGAAAAFRPFDAARASVEAKQVGEEQLDATLRFAKEQDETMRAVRVAVEAKRKEGRAEAWKDRQNRQMAEAQQAAAAGQSARQQAGTGLAFPDGHVHRQAHHQPAHQMADAQKMQQAAQEHGHRAVAGQGIPDRHIHGHPRQQMTEAPDSAAAAQSAREQAMMARQAAAAQQQHHHVVAQNGTGVTGLATAAAASWGQQEMNMRAIRGDELLYHPAVHYAAKGSEHPNSRQRTALQMVHAQQLAAAEDIVWEQEMMLRQAAAAEELARDQNMMGLDATMVHGFRHGHHPDLHQQTAQQGLLLMPGAKNMAFLRPGGSADAEALLVPSSNRNRSCRR